MLSPELLKILCCPETRQDLHLANPALVEEINRRITAGTLQNRAGATLHEPIEAGLVRSDSALLYPIRNGIPIMLTDEAINLTEDLRSGRATVG